jgi:hypothetical protein
MAANDNTQGIGLKNPQRSPVVVENTLTQRVMLPAGIRHDQIRIRLGKTHVGALKSNFSAGDTPRR